MGSAELGVGNQDGTDLTDGGCVIKSWALVKESEHKGHMKIMNPRIP